VRACALAALLAGCCPAAIVGEDVEPPPGADEALEMVHAEYTAAFDSPRREVSISWVASIETGEGPRLGWSTSCGDIWIAVSDGDAPSDTSLAHEVAHCYASHMPAEGCGGYDDSHSEVWIWGETAARGDGGLVDDIRYLLADAGL
jgi:hypothetical protein